MTRLALCLVAAFAPWLARADDGMAAAVQAAHQTWPGAVITAQGTSGDCDGRVEADAPGPARNGIAQVRLRCNATPGWTRYLALRVEQRRAIAVLRAPLAAGQALTTDLITWQTRDALRLAPDVITDSQPLTALMARRTLPAGSVLLRSQFTAPQAVQRGQLVTLWCRMAGMEVRAPGEALADAALGARVQVRNKASRRIVEGIAQGNGLVEVPS